MNVLNEIKEGPATTHASAAGSDGGYHVTGKTVFLAGVVLVGLFLAYTVLHKKTGTPGATAGAANTAPNTTPDSSTLAALTASIDALAQSEQHMQAGTMAGQQAQAQSGAANNATALQGLAGRPDSCPGGVNPLQYPDGSWYCPLPPSLPLPAATPLPQVIPGQGYNQQGVFTPMSNGLLTGGGVTPASRILEANAYHPPTWSAGPERPLGAAMISPLNNVPSSIPQVVVSGHTGRGSSSLSIEPTNTNESPNGGW